jgi:hypothetical protein
MVRTICVLSLLLVGLLLISAKATLQASSIPSSRPTAAENSLYRANKKDAASQQSNSYATPAIFGASIASNLHPQIYNHAEVAEYESAEYRLNRLQTWFNGFLMSFTGALVVVGLWQARRLRQTVEATKKAADAAKANADAAKQSAEISADAVKLAEQNINVLINSESPYLDVVTIELGPSCFSAYKHTLDSPQIETNRLIPAKPTVVITLRNVGRTPAFDINVVTNFSCVPASGWQPVVPAIARREMIIGSGASEQVECVCDSTLSRSEITEIEECRSVILADCYVSFSDIGGEREIWFSFPASYLPLREVGMPHFDFPGWPRARGIINKKQQS